MSGSMKKSRWRPRNERMFRSDRLSVLARPAKAVTQGPASLWIPACAEMSAKSFSKHGRRGPAICRRPLSAMSVPQSRGTHAMSRPVQIRMGGYGPATTGFSKALKFVGDRLERQFGDRIDVKYVWNIMDFGYRAEDILWLVE